MPFISFSNFGPVVAILRGYRLVTHTFTEENKQNSIRPIPIVLFCILAISLLSVPDVQGAVQPKEMIFTSNVVEEREGCLIACLKQKAEMRIPDDFKTVSGVRAAGNASMII